MRAWRASGPREAALAAFEWAVTQRDPALLADTSRPLQDALRLDVEDPAVLSALGSIALSANRFPEAVSFLSKALAKDRKNPDAYFRLGRAEHAAGHPDAARKLFEEAIRLDPLFFDAYALTAQMHRTRGDMTGYRRVLLRYLQHAPQSLAARQALAAVTNQGVR